MVLRDIKELGLANFEDAKPSCHYGIVAMTTPTIIPLSSVIMRLVKSVSSCPPGSVLNE